MRSRYPERRELSIGKALQMPLNSDAGFFREHLPPEQAEWAKSNRPGFHFMESGYCEQPIHLTWRVPLRLKPCRRLIQACSLKHCLHDLPQRAKRRGRGRIKETDQSPFVISGDNQMAVRLQDALHLAQC